MDREETELTGMGVDAPLSLTRGFLNSTSAPLADQRFAVGVSALVPPPWDGRGTSLRVATKSPVTAASLHPTASSTGTAALVHDSHLQDLNMATERQQ